MKKKIAILGSTGSIGKNLINIIENDKKKFEIILLTANKDYKSLYPFSFFEEISSFIEPKYDFLKSLAISTSGSSARAELSGFKRKLINRSSDIK